MAQNGHMAILGHMAIGSYAKKIWASEVSLERATYPMAWVVKRAKLNFKKVFFWNTLVVIIKLCLLPRLGRFLAFYGLKASRWSSPGPMKGHRSLTIWRITLCCTKCPVPDGDITNSIPRNALSMYSQSRL